MAIEGLIKPEYPREDVCEKCGAHVGWVMNEVGELFALGRCDDHPHEEKQEEGEKVPEWPKYVNAYDHNRAWGGPEEGGWWYDTGELIASMPCLNEAQVEEAKERLKELFGGRFEGNHPIGSVLCEGVLQILVEDEPGKDYPEVRPHYE